MKSISRNDSNTSQELIQEYLDNGGEITYCAPGERTENIATTGGMWGRKKKTTPPTEEKK